MTETDEFVEWKKTPWEVPKEQFPRIANDGKTSVGVPLIAARPPRIYGIFEAIWYGRDDKIWDMLPFKRDEWFNKIMADFWTYHRRIRFDGTKRFRRQIKKLLRKGGFVGVIGGDPSGKGDGKSILGQILLALLEEEGITVKPVILFEHAFMQVTIDDLDTDGWIVLLIDEDLTATGNESGYLLVEILNTWQTNRKPKLIIISIGIDPKSNSSAVDIHMVPAGICEKHQTTRFSCNARGKFLCWAALQRLFGPDKEVFYRGKNGLETGTLAEYEDRAVAYSRKVTREGISAIPKEVKESHIELVMEWLEIERKSAEEAGVPWGIPSLDVLITEAEFLGLPTKTASYPRRICATAVYRFGRKNPEAKKKITESVDLSVVMSDMVEFWEDYHQVVFMKYPNEYSLADRDSWMVTYRQMGFKDREIQEELKLTMRVNSIGERIRKGVSEWKVLPSNTELGTIGEKFIGSRIDSLSAGPIAYARSLDEPASKDQPDISDTGLSRNASWALNVKTSMEHDFDRVFETSPEHLTNRSWCIFLFPRLARLAICDISAETSRFNSAGMVLCGIEEGIKRIVEMIKR